ncbi:MAG: c-type cytochrome [Gammaproteobacteria bacterium]|nr:c-type cytochrome [Gammaproteobacteria bacterium]
MFFRVVPMLSLAVTIFTPLFTAQAADLTPIQALGKQLFFDARLSSPAGQSCAHCHSPQHGFSDPRSDRLPVSEGVRPGRFTPRNAPTVTYLARAPEFHFDKKQALHRGGFFMDGRAATLEQQVLGPVMSPVEMANTGKADIVNRLNNSGYTSQFRHVFGTEVLSQEQSGIDALALALAAYVRSTELNSFSSKYDAYLAGQVRLTQQELRGLRLFEDEKKGNCAACHPSRPDNGAAPLFTDFSYDNLGVPANPASPFYTQDPQFNADGKRYIDTGLGKILNDATGNGKFKVPTLRNIALTAPYMHNGVFGSLREVVEFYNARDVSSKWAAAEVRRNINKDELGDLGLTDQEIDDIVAFMKTLTDGYSAVSPVKCCE